MDRGQRRYYVYGFLTWLLFVSFSLFIYDTIYQSVSGHSHHDAHMGQQKKEGHQTEKTGESEGKMVMEEMEEGTDEQIDEEVESDEVESDIEAETEEDIEAVSAFNQATPSGAPADASVTPTGREGDVTSPESADEKINDAPVVYLTFDDGPSHVTDDLLQLLDQYDVEATFFMLEPRMKKYAQSVAAIVHHGHGVGVHGVTHDRKKFYASSQSVLSEMAQAQQALKEITGVNSALIRVPYGSVPFMKPEYLTAVEEHGFILWDWNVDSRDWYFRDKRYVAHVIKQVEQVLKRNESPVILLHDLEETYHHLPELLDYFKEKGHVLAKITPDMEPVQFSQE